MASGRDPGVAVSGLGATVMPKIMAGCSGRVPVPHHHERGG